MIDAVMFLAMVIGITGLTTGLAAWPAWHDDQQARESH